MEENLDRAPLDFVNLDSARQSQIEAKRSEQRSPAPSGQGETEDRFDEVAASPNSQNLAADGLDWFKEGLRFKCTGCGKCCTGSPGYVFLSHTDLDRLSTHFSLSPEAFSEKYTHRVDEKISLIDQPGSDHCVFLVNNQCSVYEARPQQCRTFPWWIQIVEDADAWNEAGKRCEGINHPDAPIVPALTIQVQCLTYLDNLLEQNFS